MYDRPHTSPMSYVGRNQFWKEDTPLNWPF